MLQAWSTLEGMTSGEGIPLIGGLQSSLFFETPEQTYARVFRELKPRTAVPDLRVEFCRFANANSFIRWEAGRLDAGNRFLPHKHSRNSVVYTGTHDNDTTRGWWAARFWAEARRSRSN